jgi:cytochrome c biogenesis protein CcdA/thiol-disulfide isomerase/thioredoxin
MDLEMSIDILVLSFLEGVGLILSPCILPILPLILVTGIQGGKLRPYGIILGFIAAFVAFTLFARQLLSVFHIDPQLLQDLSIYFILAFGVILFSDYLSDKFSASAQRLANLGQNLSAKAETKLPSGFLSGVILGVGIAFVWTPCAGPIMAAVLVQTLQQQADYQAFFILTAFSIGVALPMLIITIFSKSIIQRVHGLAQHTRLVRKVLASTIIITMLFTKFNVWQKLFELGGPSLAAGEFMPATQLLDPLAKPYPAPEISGTQKWFNSEPFTLKAMQSQGKVVLIDFWTYSCINCVRTLPYIKNWHEKYHDKGLVIIGVHSPEFEFEKNEKNVAEAIKSNGIKYPVVMDNDLKTWQNFQNHYWPAHYLINKDGQVVYVHFGEGDYDITENNIRFLLGLGTMKDYMKPEVPPSPVSPAQSPETYLGFERSAGMSSPEKMLANEPVTYTYPQTLELNTWALNGSWLVSDQKIVAQQPGASLRYHFQAKEAFLVLASNDPSKPITARILLDGKPLGPSAGKDVKDGKITVTQSTLYELVHLKGLSTGILEIQSESAGLEAYAFTFGAE